MDPLSLHRRRQTDRAHSDALSRARLHRVLHRALLAGFPARRADRRVHIQSDDRRGIATNRNRRAAAGDPAAAGNSLHSGQHRDFDRGRDDAARAAATAHETRSDRWPRRAQPDRVRRAAVSALLHQLRVHRFADTVDRPLPSRRIARTGLRSAARQSSVSRRLRAARPSRRRPPRHLADATLRTRRERRPAPSRRPRLRSGQHALVPRHGDLRLDSAGDALDPPRRRDHRRQRAGIVRDRLDRAAHRRAAKKIEMARALQRRRGRCDAFLQPRHRPLLRWRRSPRADRISVAYAARNDSDRAVARVPRRRLRRSSSVSDLSRRPRRDRSVLRNLVRRHSAHHRRRLVTSVSGHDDDLPQQPQSAHAVGLHSVRALPIHSQSARDRSCSAR